jgi:DNA-binding transcriptional ArsR family regulator
MSQHLSRLRRDKLVKTRRKAQTIFYSLAGEESRLVLEALYAIYCQPGKPLIPDDAKPYEDQTEKTLLLA